MRGVALVVGLPVLVACASSRRASKPETSHVVHGSAEVMRKPTLLERKEREVAAFEDGCQRGQPDACSQLADALETGHYIAPDRQRAHAIRMKLCDAGTGDACTALAGEVELPDAERLELSHRACDLGELEQCMQWANALPSPEGDQLRGHVFETLARECENGDTDACFTAQRVEIAARTKLPAEQWKAALDREVASCLDDHPEACMRAARIHAQRGEGADAREDRLHACDLGDGQACADQAALEPYRSETANDLYRQACALQVADACWTVASSTSDPIESAVTYVRGCELDDHDACSTLAARLESGHAERRDMARAAEIRKRMCRAGDADQCIAIAELASARNDPAAAIALYGRACDLGDIFYGCSGKAAAMHAECVRGKQVTCAALDAFLSHFTPARRDFVAYECCADRPGVGTSPAAAFVRLKAAAGTKDADALRALIDPTSGLHVRIGSHGPDFAHEDNFDVRTTDADFSRITTVAQIGFKKVECPDDFADTEVICTGFEGGFYGTYRFRQIDNHVYVFAIDEESH